LTLNTLQTLAIGMWKACEAKAHFETYMRGHVDLVTLILSCMVTLVRCSLPDATFLGWRDLPWEMHFL